VVGFAVMPRSTFNVVHRVSPEFINKVNKESLNYISFAATQWIEKPGSEDTREQMVEAAKFLKEKVPGIKASDNALVNSPSRDEISNTLVLAIQRMNSTALNTVDTFQNTSLHYLVHRRLFRPTEALLNNNSFNRTHALNGSNKNALFMLLDEPCDTISTKEGEIRMLDLLLKNRLNPLQRNHNRFTFAAFVLTNERFKHLREPLLQNLNPVQTRLAQQDALNLKSIEEFNKQNNLDIDILSFVDHESIRDFYSCE